MIRKGQGAGALQWAVRIVGTGLVIVSAVVAVVLLSRGSQEPTCDPPCWRGIIPGETTYDEVDRILGSASDLAIEYRRPVSGGSEQWLFHSTAPPAKNEREEYFQGLPNAIIGTDGVVESISVSPYPLRFAQEIIDQLGPPEKMVATRTGTEVISFVAYLYYPQKGTIVELGLEPSGGSPLTLAPSSVVHRLRYFEPRSMDDWFKPSWIVVPGYGIREHWRDWPGFGPVEVTIQR